MKYLPIDFNEKSCIHDMYLALTVGDLIDIIFSHNEIISLDVPEWDENGIQYSKTIWRGHAHQLPNEYKSYSFLRIFGCIAENITKSDTLHIECCEPMSIGDKQFEYNIDYANLLRPTEDIYNYASRRDN